jgi:hypothetical protein
MTEDEAFEVLIPLTSRFQGWNDELVNLWVDDLVRLTSLPAAEHAARVCVDSHEGWGPPPWAMFISIYRGHVQREGTDAIGELEPGAVPTFDRGIEIAKEAYRGQRRQMLKPIDENLVAEAFEGVGRAERRERARDRFGLRRFGKPSDEVVPDNGIE